MIKTKTDLRYYLAEDARMNRMQRIPYWKYLVKLFAGSESAHVYRYIKRLRYTEYHHNNKGLWTSCFITKTCCNSIDWV